MAQDPVHRKHLRMRRTRWKECDWRRRRKPFQPSSQSSQCTNSPYSYLSRLLPSTSSSFRWSAMNIVFSLLLLTLVISRTTCVTASSSAVDDEQFWSENADLLTAYDNNQFGNNAVKMAQNIDPGFKFCRQGTNELECSETNGTYDLMQNSEGLLDEAIKLMFRPPAGKSIENYNFKARSTNEKLLRNDKIGIDPIRSEDVSGDAIVNATIGVSFEQTVGETDLIVTAQDKKGSDDREFKLRIAVAGMMFTESDVSTPQRESEYLDTVSRFGVKDPKQHVTFLDNAASRSKKGDRWVAEGRFEQNELQITSWESLVRNKYVYIKVDRQFTTSTMSKELRIRDIKVEFERETYAKQIKWSEDKCRIATTSKRPVRVPKDPRAVPDPEHMNRPRPGFLKGVNPREAVNLTRSECGISFSYTGDLLGLRFEKYRVGNGRLRIHFKLHGFKINGRSATFETDLRIRILNHHLVPPAFHRLEAPDKLNPNGGDEIHCIAFNTPKDTNQRILMAAMVGKERKFFAEDFSKRRASGIYGDMQLTFVSLPGKELIKPKFLLTTGGHEMRSTSIGDEDIEQVEGAKVFKHVQREVPILEYGTQEPHENDIDYTFGFVNVSTLDIARKLSEIRRKYGEAAGIGPNNVFSVDCEAGSFYAIHGRTGVIAGLASSSNTATKLLKRATRFFSDWVQVSDEERGTPPPLPTPASNGNGPVNALGNGGEEIIRKMEGEKVKLRFRIPPEKKIESLAKIEEYTASGKAMEDLGAEVHMVTDSDTEEQIRFAGGTLNIAALTSLVATVVAAVGVQLGSTVAAGAAVSMIPAALSGGDGTWAAGGAATSTGKYTTSNANPTTILRAVQVTSARGFVSSQGVTSPYTNVAEGASSFLLLVKAPWKKNDPVAPTVRIIRSASNVLSYPWEKPVPGNLKTHLSTSVKVAQPVADILNDKNIEGLFIGQLFWIAIAVVVFAAFHCFVHFGLKKLGKKRARAILLDILPKMYLLFLNYIHLGIFIGGFRLLLAPEKNVFLKIVAGVLIVVVGIGYPAGVLWFLKSKVAPNLNQAWMEKYASRYIFRGGWKWFRRYNDAELRNIEGAWRKRDMENPISQHWFIERKTRRFSGAWVSAGDKFQLRFGDIFEQYRGQYYLFFFWELLELSAEGIALGALARSASAQAFVIISVSVLNLLVLLWLVPYNDLFEQVVQLFIALVNVMTAAVALSLVSVKPVTDQAKLYSSVQLWLNVSAIIGAAIYGTFAAGEIMWHSRDKIAKFFRKLSHRGSLSGGSTSRSSSSRSSSSRSTSSSIPSDDLQSDPGIESDDDLIENTYHDPREPYNRDGSPLEAPDSGNDSGSTGDGQGRLQSQDSISTEDSGDVSDRTLSSASLDSAAGGPVLRGMRTNKSTISLESNDQSAISDKGSKASGEREEVVNRDNRPGRVLSFVKPPNSQVSNWTDDFEICSSADSTAGGSIGGRQSSIKAEDLKDKKRSYVLGSFDRKQTWYGGEEIMAGRRSSASGSSSTTSDDTLTSRSSRRSTASGQSLTIRRSSRESALDNTPDDVDKVD